MIISAIICPVTNGNRLVGTKDVRTVRVVGILTAAQYLCNHNIKNVVDK